MFADEQRAALQHGNISARPSGQLSIKRQDLR